MKNPDKNFILIKSVTLIDKLLLFIVSLTIIGLYLSSNWVGMLLFVGWLGYIVYGIRNNTVILKTKASVSERSQMKEDGRFLEEKI